MTEPSADASGPAERTFFQKLVRRLNYTKLDRYRMDVAGTPKSGRKFDPNWHVDWWPSVTQAEIDAMAGGTWTHPPYPRSARAMAYFWMNVPVPDEVVDVAAGHCPKGTHQEVVRTLCRVSALLHTAAGPDISEDEGVRIYQLAIPFPDGSVFRPMDALRWWGVEEAHRYMRLTPRTMTPWLTPKGR